jgi:putative ABC transport system permease protein
VTSVLYLAWRYLAYHRFKTVLLVLSIALILFLPAGLAVLAGQGERHLTARANATPLLIGAKGSPLELTLASLYFRSKVPEVIRFDETARVAESGLAAAIPLYVRFRSGDDPIVGTSLDYFRFRGLRIAEGRQMGRLGDCVVGARVARRRELRPGGSVLSSPEQAFDLAGVHPLKMRVTGVLAFSDGPDDDAIFVDVKTAWVIEGLGHGHGDVAKMDPGGGGPVTVRQPVAGYTEVTDENLDSFHFHGDPAGFPITAVLAVPPDEKSATRLIGRYRVPDQKYQIIEPARVMGELLATVVTVKTFALAALALVGLAALALVGLIQALSLRLRQREIETLHQIGGSRVRVLALLASEGVGVLLLGGLIATGLTAATAAFGAEAVRFWVAR